MQVCSDDASTETEKESKDMLVNTDVQKYKDLYAQIEKYFETNLPFVNPDFTAAQLASALNTNIAYISKAINQQRDINFNVFVNHYRIEKVKQMMRDSSNKYTLEYISSSSGFRNQSTFNKAFKSIEGITPSAYSKANEVRE
jgi:AraC-like DNA-binding protein